ncbi:MAG: VPLPA-CTERM sorting domain-containing protein [Pseudomonadota bacterium]
MFAKAGQYAFFVTIYEVTYCLPNIYLDVLFRLYWFLTEMNLVKDRILAAAVATLVVGFSSMASAAVIDTNNWSHGDTPTYVLNADSWVTGGTGASYTSNSGGSLTSDFTSSGNYTYSGSVRSTGSDNDNMGFLLGWTDGSNHIRIGMEGGGFGDNAVPFPYLANGFWIVEEVAGVSTLLYEQSGFSFNSGQTYDISLTVTGSSINFDFGSGGSTIYTDTIVASATTSGKVGLYTESQTAQFSSLEVVENNGPAPVPLPAGLPLLLAGLGGLGLIRLKRG